MPAQAFVAPEENRCERSQQIEIAALEGRSPYETCAYRKYATITSGTRQFQKGSRLQSGAEARRPMGRPRDARADRAILEATLELIAERGVHEFRTEDVAARAGVGKGAIYRRYRSKDELVTAAIAALVSEEIVVPDTGSTREDLLALMREAVEALPRLARRPADAEPDRCHGAEAGVGARGPGRIPGRPAGGAERGASARRRARRPAPRPRCRARARRARRAALLPAARHRRPDRRAARRGRRRPDPARLRTGRARAARSPRSTKEQRR